MIDPLGFREYDARWAYPSGIDLEGVEHLGLSLGTQMARHGKRSVVVGSDYRSYSGEVRAALIAGLVRAGARVLDIGTALSPMAYFAQGRLGADAVAMVTASHNPNGWTGVKMGLDYPVTHGPDEMAELREIALNGQGIEASGGTVEEVAGMRAAYLDDLVGTFRLTRPLRVICATGNGTAGDFAPELLARIGAEVIGLHTELNWDFPNYNPNPEALEMLHDMAAATRAHHADLALGFDGDGDRCGVVDETGEEVFADKVGLMLARDLAPLHPGAQLVVDVKSTGLYATDPVLAAHGVTTEYWKTGHSYMKRRVRDTGALAGFEKSGHYFLAEPIGHGYDCGLRVAVEICRMLDRNPDRSFGDLARALGQSWSSPTMSPFCPDDQKYGVVDRVSARLKTLTHLAGLRITDVITVNGARVQLEGGGWGLIRASSNTPNLVVVCESMTSYDELYQIFDAMDRILRAEPSVGEYDQRLAPIEKAQT
jgi:phosphomannomutase/phosphoglucomutase